MREISGHQTLSELTDAHVLNSESLPYAQAALLTCWTVVIGKRTRTARWVRESLRRFLDPEFLPAMQETRSSHACSSSCVSRVLFHPPHLSSRRICAPWKQQRPHPTLYYCRCHCTLPPHPYTPCFVSLQFSLRDCFVERTIKATVLFQTGAKHLIPRWVVAWHCTVGGSAREKFQLCIPCNTPHRVHATLFLKKNISSVHNKLGG